jgi:uncharacterized protein (DUF488 family)
VTDRSEFTLLTIGHSNQPAERFLALLRDAGVRAVADVRSVPHSRRFPWFSAKPLRDLLDRQGIAYLGFGETLGGRPPELAFYRDGVADYEAMAAAPAFRAGLDRAIEQAQRTCLCLMCSEREPLDCHRCLLIGRELAARGLPPGHIMGDGTIEPHAMTEERLLTWAQKSSARNRSAHSGGDLFSDRNELLAGAYRRRARAIAARIQHVRGPRQRTYDA